MFHLASSLLLPMSSSSYLQSCDLPSSVPRRLASGIRHGALHSWCSRDLPRCSLWRAPSPALCSRTNCRFSPLHSVSQHRSYRLSVRSVSVLCFFHQKLIPYLGPLDVPCSCRTLQISDPQHINRDLRVRQRRLQRRHPAHVRPHWWPKHFDGSARNRHRSVPVSLIFRALGKAQSTCG